MASGPRGRLPGRFVGASHAGGASGRVGVGRTGGRVFGLGQSTARRPHHTGWPRAAAVEEEGGDGEGDAASLSLGLDI